MINKDEKKLFSYLKKQTLPAKEKSAFRRELKIIVSASSFSYQDFSKLSIMSFSWYDVRQVLARGVALTGILGFIGVTTFSAAANSLPGDALYPIKNSRENMQAVLLLDDRAQAAFQTKQVERRLSEVEKLANRGDLTEEKSESIKQVITENVKRAKNENNELAETVNAEEAIEASLTLDSTLKVYGNILSMLSETVAELDAIVEVVETAQQEVEDVTLAMVEKRGQIQEILKITQDSLEASEKEQSLNTEVAEEGSVETQESEVFEVGAVEVDEKVIFELDESEILITEEDGVLPEEVEVTTQEVVESVELAQTSEETLLEAINILENPTASADAVVEESVISSEETQTREKQVEVTTEDMLSEGDIEVLEQRADVVSSETLMIGNAQNKSSQTKTEIGVGDMAIRADTNLKALNRALGNKLSKNQRQILPHVLAQKEEATRLLSEANKVAVSDKALSVDLYIESISQSKEALSILRTANVVSEQSLNHLINKTAEPAKETAEAVSGDQEKKPEPAKETGDVLGVDDMTVSIIERVILTIPEENI